MWPEVLANFGPLISLIPDIPWHDLFIIVDENAK